MKTKARTNLKYPGHASKNKMSTPENYVTKSGASTAKNIKGNAQKQGNAAARQLLREWQADETGYDEETWPILKQALEENRFPSGRRLFRD